jgi:hypothetical protein
LLGGQVGFGGAQLFLRDPQLRLQIPLPPRLNANQPTLTQIA